MDAKAQKILEGYEADVERWKERGGHYKDIQPLSIQDIIFIRTILHPTNKQESKDLTKALIIYIVENKICTASDIYKTLGYSDKPVLRRLKLFLQCGLVRRESKKYYLPTPRMIEIKERYLRRICE